MVQVDPIKPTLKAPVSRSLKLKCDELLSNVAFKFNLRRYNVGCLLAPFCFTWGAFSSFLVMYFITGCLGITLSYHRQLSHKAFTTPKAGLQLCAHCVPLASHQGITPSLWCTLHC